MKPALAALAFMAVVAAAARAQSPTALAKDSPFSGPASPAATAARPTEPVQLTGVSASAAGVRLCLYDLATRHSRWLGVGAAADGIQVVSYDENRQAAVISLGGVQHTVTLQEWQTASLAAASPEAKAREARLLSGDLLDIGLQQRKAAAAQKSAGN